jgi:proliferating cell nuclear antigen
MDCMLKVLVAIECTKEGVKFEAAGDIGKGCVTLRQHSNVDKPELNVEIDLSEPVALSFSLKYLVNFTKATGLSSQVKICLSNEVPLLVEYSLANNSYLRFYLAPKVLESRSPDPQTSRLMSYRLEMKSKSISVIR